MRYLRRSYLTVTNRAIILRNKPKTLISHPIDGGLGKESIIFVREDREGAYYNLHSERSNDCIGNPNRDLRNFCALWTVRTNDAVAIITITIATARFCTFAQAHVQSSIMIWRLACR